MGLCAQAHASGLVLQAAFPQACGWGAARSWSALCCSLNALQSSDTAKITCPAKKDKVGWKESNPTGRNLWEEWAAICCNANCVGHVVASTLSGSAWAHCSQNFNWQQRLMEILTRLFCRFRFQVEAGAKWSCSVIDVARCFIFISCDEEVGGWRLLEVPG